ncbi:DUF1189 domain-containing protein [Neobacillus sp. SM06]|uniref:DUF1189 domain-containing protein n=1 Tax=Neobacillus sp. SM06 TaxID=3422492 RepID=UPI003D289CC3
MNIFKQFYKSIYSPKDIALFRFQGIGKTILYVFLLTLLSILPSVYFLSQAINAGIDSARAVLKDQLPSFTINNGQLQADTNVPITIDQGNFTIILDPTGAITPKKLSDTDNSFAILKNEFVLMAGGQTESYAYSMIQGMQLNKQDILDFLDMVNGLKWMIIPLVSLLIYFFSAASNFIEVSILALFGLGLRNLAGRKLNYRQLWRMAAYSETLPTMFFTIMAALKTNVPSSFFINWFVAIMVLFLAIKETPTPKNTEERRN